MKRIGIIIAGMLATFTGMSAEVDGVAVRVGADTILKSDIIMEMRRIGAPDSEYVNVRNEMIDRKLIIKAAADAKMTMQDWVVESRIREIIKKAFDGDRNKLMDTLSQQKISYPEWHARMKEDMIVAAMRWNVIDKNITASPSAMKREYTAHPERYATERKTTVAVILLRPTDASLREEINAKLGGTDFKELAKKYSADTHASEGGIWKDINPDDYFKREICEEIAKMPKGTISHWIELDGWSYLLKKIDEQFGRQKSFSEAYEDIEATVKEDEAKKAYDAWIARLRDETYIKVY